MKPSAHPSSGLPRSGTRAHHSSVGVMTEGLALFDTALGRCGIAWTERGVGAVQLPELTDDATLARLHRRRPAARERAPSAEAVRAIEGMSALLGGERVDLGDVVLDMEDVAPFHRRVFELARTIPAGATSTYGELAARLGDPGAARAVGEALGRNPLPIVVPCHRVLAANGRLGGFSAHGGAATKRRMLIIEGALLELEL
jgi:methylated-DNA-[protein]-cysteine S-methyltransferase